MLKNSSGRVRVAKKKFESGRVAGTRQGLIITRGRRCGCGGGSDQLNRGDGIII